MELNELTKRMIKEGYTADRHPDWVRVPPTNYMPDKDKPLYNFEGGFTFKRSYVDELTYETPCGLLLKGKYANAGMYFQGINFCFENFNPWISCPICCVNCQKRDEPFKTYGTGTNKSICAVHETDREYKYKGSCEHLKKISDQKKEAEKQKFIQEHQGRVCVHHMRYDVETGWSFHYNPEQECQNGYCKAVNGYGTPCPVLGRELSRKKANIYYDLEFEGRDYSKDGTFFEGDRFHQVIKGIQYTKKPINLDIAEVIVKLCKKDIIQSVRYSNHIDSRLAFLAEQGKLDYQWRVINIRVEKKAVRDFDQDLQDIESGIKVIHEIDAERIKKQNKQERRQQSKDRALKKLEKQIIKSWDDMDSFEKARAYKKLGEEKVEELLMSREKDPEQMTIYDFLS